MGFRHFYHVRQYQHTYQHLQNFLLHILVQDLFVSLGLILWVRLLQFLLQVGSFYSFLFSQYCSIVFLYLKIPVVHFVVKEFLWRNFISLVILIFIESLSLIFWFCCENLFYQFATNVEFLKAQDYERDRISESL